MKNELRKKYKTLRKSLNEAEKEELSLRIFNLTTSFFNLTNKEVSIFIPISKFNEIDTWQFLENLQANYYLPVVKKKLLQHIKYNNRTQLKISDWGILEPTNGVQVDPSIFDFVIVPLLAYDTKGSRVGYGAGFYDSFLKDCHPNCKFIGVSFFEPENDLIVTYPTDIPLDYCVTPYNVHAFI